MSVQIITDSVYGCAGQRCLAASNIITVGDDGNIKEAYMNQRKKEQQVLVWMKQWKWDLLSPRKAVQEWKA